MNLAIPSTISRPCLAAVPALLAATGAFAQCPSTTSMIDTYRAAAPSIFGQQQNPASGWT